MLPTVFAAEWADDPGATRQCKVPEAIRVRHQTAIALQLLESMSEREAMPEFGVADEAYGVNTLFREQYGEGFTYMVGVTGTVSLQVRRPGAAAGERAGHAIAISTLFRTLTLAVKGPTALCRRALRQHGCVASRAKRRQDEVFPMSNGAHRVAKAEVEPSNYFLVTLPADTPHQDVHWWCSSFLHA